MSSKCLLCECPLDSGGDVVQVMRGIDGLVKASVMREDGLEEVLKNLRITNSEIRVHSTCRKNYTRLCTIKKDASSKRRNSQDKSPDSTIPRLRSTIPTFNFLSDCFYCGEEASSRKETKKAFKYRRVIHEVETKETKRRILHQAESRKDDWGDIVKARVDSVVDLIAAEAKYHHACQLLFFSPGTLDGGCGKGGRPEDCEKAQAFETLCEFMEQCDDSQFSLGELVEQMESLLDPGSASASSTSIYSHGYLKEKLQKRYGDAVFFTERTGVPTIVNFKGTAGTILYDKWYSERKSSSCDERLRIVQAAAEIILQDIRSTVYQTDTYPTAGTDSLSDEGVIPLTLQHFLETVITSKGTKEKVVSRKRTAIGQAIVSACRPRSFIAPILLCIGVFTHLTGSRELVDMLSSMSFSVTYKEVHRYECSAMELAPNNEEASGAHKFTQYAFDNADFNIRTLTGHGTFHSMGGLRFTTPAPKSTPRRIRRILNPPSAADIAAKGKVHIQWYKKPNSLGLKAVPIRELDGISSESFRSMKSSQLMNFLWSSGSWSGVESPPLWNGFMRAVTNTGAVCCSVTREEPLPFINLDPSNPSTIYSALLFAIQDCKRNGQSTCCVTFDQPLFAKASEIVAAAQRGELDSVVLRLGGFHLLMSFLGSIGFIMSGSGLEELWSLVYAKNSVTHMISGHAFSRALRAHNLTFEALITLLLAPSLGLQTVQKEVKFLFMQAMGSNSDDRNDTILNSEALNTLLSSIQKTAEELSSHSRTAALWIEYIHQVEIVHHFIRAERTGNWSLHLHAVKEMLPYFHAAGHFPYAKAAHLYVQKMEELESKMPTNEFFSFVEKGFFTIRRKGDIWGGVWSDMAIEQSLMRPLKAKGGLTRGRGITESTLAHFVSAFPGCLPLCSALEVFTGVRGSSSDQHVEMRDTRRLADQKHSQIFKSWLEEHSPWDVSSSCLRSLSSGVVGDSTINPDRAKTVGLSAMRQMIGGNFGDIKLTRKNRVNPLSHVSGTVVVRDDVVPVNTIQLLWRIICVMKSPAELQMYLSFELAPKPPSLFDSGLMRQTSKAVLLQKFEFSAPSDSPPGTCVVDGGYLLRAHRWPRPATYGQISESYRVYVQKHFSNICTVVFDGYEEDLNTKGEAHSRRSTKKCSADVVFDTCTIASATQDDFLCNKANKTRLIRILSTEFQEHGIEVRQAKGDADRLIVDTAIAKDIISPAVTVVATDTDILVLLIAKARVHTGIQLLSPGTNSSPGKVYRISELLDSLADLRHCILFTHAITGCDTTSALKGKGKANPWKLMKQNPPLQKLADVFNSPRSSHADVAVAGEAFIKRLYGAEDTISVDDLRVQLYSRHIATQSVGADFDLAVLPPTTSACRQHSYRAYLQVQEWLGNNLNPVDWGWRIAADGCTLIPVAMETPPAPESLLHLISCGCKGDCSGGRCECRRSGLNCSRMCANCKGNSCTNVGEVEEDVDDPEPEIV